MLLAYFFNMYKNSLKTFLLQVVELLRYFSWAEPQLKAIKALQHVSSSGIILWNKFACLILF